MTEVYLSIQAQRKMTERGVSFDEVRWATLNPEVTWRNSSISGQMYEIRSYKDIAVVVAKRSYGLQVMSILWRTKEQWTDGEMFIDRVIYQSPKVEKVTQKKKRGRK